MLCQSLPMAIGEGLPFRLSRSLGLRTQHLPREMVAHTANARDDLVAEQRMIGCCEQV